jgi:glycosyltransferase involved in cell wall biosynthesis
MKLAFVDCLPVGGGLSRYCIALTSLLLKNYPDLKIDYFVHSSNLNKLNELKYLNNLNIIILESSKNKSIIASKLIYRYNKLFKRNKYHGLFSELKKCLTDEYDLAFFPTAYMMKRPNLRIPIVGAFHDFNWKYVFGQPIFDKCFIEEMEQENKKWLENGYNICVSNFTLKELKFFYSEISSKVVAIPLGNPIFTKENYFKNELSVLRELKINFPYLIYPANFYPHKNHRNLFTAFSQLVKRKGFENYKLILTGAGTEHFTYSNAVDFGAKQSDINDFNILGLGYQENYVIDILIKNARMLVSPSLYEAQCMPGMDAWSLGTPTAISDIEPYRENESLYSIKTAFFNPLNPDDIANVLEFCLVNYQSCLSNAELSKENIHSYSDRNVALDYMQVFREAMQ